MIDSLLAQELAKPYPSAVRIVGVKIRDLGEVKKFDAGDAILVTGDRVMLDVAGELSYGVVYAVPQLTPFIPPMRVIQPISRKATTEDVATIDRYERLASEGMKACREQTAALRLKMKLVEVFCSLHRRQMTFVYTAEDRIDFQRVSPVAGASIRWTDRNAPNRCARRSEPIGRHRYLWFGIVLRELSHGSQARDGQAGSDPRASRG